MPGACFLKKRKKPCASGKIFCVKNGGSACYFGAAVLIYKYHSNVPGRVVCFGKAGKVFSTEYADRGAGLMRTRNNGQAAVSGRGGTAEGAAACLGGVSWAVGEYPADCHKICGALSRRIFQRRLRPVALCALCAPGLLFFPACVRVSERRACGRTQEEEQYEKKDSAAAHAGGRCWCWRFCARCRLLRKAARRTNRVRAWWNARNAAARGACMGMPGQGRGMRGVRREKHLRGLRRLRQDRGGKPVLQYGMVPAAAAPLPSRWRSSQKRCILHCL